MILFYTLVFGKDEYFKQATLLVASLLAKKGTSDIKIKVFTDNPNFFKFLQSYEEVEIILLDKQKIAETTKKHYNYFFANKLELMSQVLKDETFDSVVFLDTDIIAQTSLTSFTTASNSGTFFMHHKEKCYSKESTPEYWRILNKIDLLGYKLDKRSSQWNSGVLAVNYKAAKRVDDAMEIMDSILLEGITQHSSEQVALSVVLEDSGNLKEAKDWFIHYHPNKGEWNKFADQFYLNYISSNETLEDCFNALTEFPKVYIKRNIFIKVLGKWKNSIKKRLIKK